MTSEHTPGPWCIKDHRNVGEGFSITNAVADGPFYDGIASLADVEADARLIAAAPELLEALRELTDDVADRFDLDSPSANPGIKSTVAAARAAVAKATGAPTDPH